MFPSSHPLLSTIITLYTLILLYFPRIFLPLIFSPIIISTAILLLTLLRLGATQRTETNSNSNSTQPLESTSADQDLKRVDSEPELEPKSELGLDPNPCFADSFVEWNVGAPLEVIYEEYEGQEEEDPSEKDPTRLVNLERYPSLSLCYPETDSDASSEGESPAVGDWEAPEKECFRWEEEDREGLIEIALDEEENMIEIDISPARSGGFSGEGSGSVNVGLCFKKGV